MPGFEGGVCPLCGRYYGNAGASMALHCQCGWPMGIHRQDVETFAEIIRRNMETDRKGAES